MPRENEEHSRQEALPNHIETVRMDGGMWDFFFYILDDFFLLLLLSVFAKENVTGHADLGLLSLLICVLLCLRRCSTDDTAQYTVVASNVHGQASSQASIIVKSKTIFDCCVSDDRTHLSAGLRVFKTEFKQLWIQYQSQQDTCRSI